MSDKSRYNPATHHRRSIRLRRYDYSLAGAYFITLCTHNQECLFGEGADGVMMLNEAGRMVQTVWNEIPIHYKRIEIDEFIVMPNHVHGIIVIVGAGPRACPDQMGQQELKRSDGGRLQGNAPDQGACPQEPCHPEDGQAQGPAPTLALFDVVHRFKTMTTKQYIDGVKHAGWKGFHGKLWQRNYWERVIRNESELNHIREYIRNNPLQWELDSLYGHGMPCPYEEPWKV